MRTIRIRNLVFDRQVTLLNVTDLELGEERQLRLEKIEKAEPIEPDELSAQA